MTWEPKHLESALDDLETVLAALKKHKKITEAEMRDDLTRRWAIEHGMLLAADLILDMLDSVLTGKFDTHPKSYEDTLMRAQSHGLLDAQTYGRLRGLGNFRNILAHPRLEADVGRYKYNFDDSLTLIPRVVENLRKWLQSK